MQIDPGPAGPPLMAKDGDSPRKIESSIFHGEEGGQGRGRGRGSRKAQAKAAAAAAAATPDFQGFMQYPPYSVPPSMPSMPMPYPHQNLPPYGQYMPPQTMMQPYMNMAYLGMPAVPMFGHVPPVPEQGAPKNAKPRRQDQGGGKNNGPREAKGKRRAKGKNAKEEPAAALEDDETLSAQLNQVRRQIRDVPLEEVLQENLVGEFAKDQYGTRYIQQKLDEAPDETKQRVYAAIRAEAPDLAKDPYGNHLVQKIFDSADAQQRKAMVSALQGHVAKLSQDQCGCRVVQKAIGAVSKESQQQISRELEDHVDDCIRNMHGNHVIQKCIEQMPPESVNFIIRAVEQRAEETARHVYGCRVIQRLLEHCVSDQLKPMLEQILCNVAVLAKDAYGNYVIQHMLEHGRKEDKQRIIQTIRANIAEFSREKYSSNVVEKCFEISTTGEHADTDLIQQERASLLNTVLEVPEVLYTLCTNTYGNYVVQRIMENARGEMELQSLFQAIKNIEHQIMSRDVPPGMKEDPREVFKHIQNYLAKVSSQTM